MNKEKYIFAQLIELLNNDKFRYIVAKYNGDKYVKHFAYGEKQFAIAIRKN